jgi:hypothetical protein
MLKEMIAKAIVVIGLLLGTSEAWGHQDTIFPIGGDGSIRGVPQQFQPASLVVRLQPGAETPEVTLTLSGHSIRFPDCLSRHFLSGKLSAHGSWYHSGSRLPPYLVLQMTPADTESSRGLRLIFDLRSAKLIRNTRSSAGATASCSAAELATMPYLLLPPGPPRGRPPRDLEERLRSTQGKGPVDVISISFTAALIFVFLVVILRRRKARMVAAAPSVDLPSARALTSGQSDGQEGES